MKNQIAVFTSLLGLIGVGTTAYMHLDTRYAHAAEFQKLQQRVLMNELHQSYRDARKEVYDLRALVRKYPNDEKLVRQLKEAEDEFQRLKELVRKDSEGKRDGD